MTPTQSTHSHDNDTQRGSDLAHDLRCPCFLQLHETQHLERGANVDRNAQFHSLSSEQREHLRCVEYQAVRLLSYVVPIYIIAWQLFGCIALGTYVHFKHASDAANNAIKPWFVFH